MASSKRQTTMAKLAREQAVKERRQRKQEKKDAKKRAAAEFAANPDGMPEEEEVPSVDDDETVPSA